jgi:adenosylmethionine-8-amino-7-oxononanoate aminotransferase
MTQTSKSQAASTHAAVTSIATTLLDADARHVWHPYTQHQTWPAPLDAVRAEGAYVYTRDGRRIFDGISSWWVTLHGHAQPEIAHAIAEQARTMEQVIFTTFTHEPAARLAEELCAVLPRGLNRLFFSDDGSTAVEAAIKMALQYHGNRGAPRNTIVAIEHAYHGDTFGAMSVSARSVFTAPFNRQLFDVRHLPAPTEGDTVAALAELLDAPHSDVAAVIIEPLVMGSGGMIMYDESIVRAMRDLTRAHGTLLIADEVLTGFGRTGPLFACDRVGIVPDILCMSKGITGGFLPMGATASTDDVFAAFLSDDRRKTLFHGHSYTANPIACAAARASLALLDDASAARRASIEATHRMHVDRLARHPLVRNPRVLGTFAAFDLADANDYLNPIGRQLADFALARDVLLRPLGSTAYVLPPYCATPDDLGAAYAVIEQFLDTQ